MASNSSLTLVLALACLVSLISPAISQTCPTQNVSGNFENCMALPQLDSYLHYTYDAANSSLSVAFVATPPRSGDWVAWAINPTARRMLGSQAFLAYSPRAGARPEVNTYNISTYNLTPGRLSFEFWNLRAESMAGNMIVIYTTVKVPAGAESVNQVWQMGGNVTAGRPGVHPMNPANMASTAVLRLTGSDAPSSAPGAAPGSVPGPTTPGGGSTTPGQAGGPRNAGSMTASVNFGVNFGILVMLATVFIF
ncbi:Auxin-induced in root cultures protein 12 [Hirschfeldia incana]|nr:Auxin-induced in root cultures protein 12 [Hirschfeldia incana]